MKMCKSLHFGYSLLLIALVPVSFCNHYESIWTVDLLNQNPGNTTSVYAVIEQNKYLLDIININTKVGFFVIQAHSYTENLTLSYDDPLQTNSYVTGTNIGLVWPRNMGKSTLKSSTAVFHLSRLLSSSKKIKVLLAISTYTKNDPVPGGCNLEFETDIAPYQKVTYDHDIITVTCQAPSKNKIFCDNENITTDMYYMYLNEFDNSTEDYFLGIEQMMTVENIQKYGTKVHSQLGDEYEQMYNLYRGTGRVFAVVSTLKGKSSAYVPTVSFGCNLNDWAGECVGPVGVHWKLICAILLIFGLFVCFGGHRYFKTGLFTVGFTFGAIFAILLISIDEDYFSTEVTTIYSVSVGFVSGWLWLLLWWKFGAPLFSVQLTFLLAGSLIASTILYNRLGDLLFLTHYIIFWLVFSAILLITLLPIFYYPSLYHIVALSLLGSYAFIVALNYYTVGNLPYILINTYRRVAVKKFGSVVVDPPFQMCDTAQTLLWVLLFGTGVYIQYKYSIGKAPFPPHRAEVQSRHVVTETTPLIQPEAPPEYNILETNTFSERTPPPSYHP